MAQLHQLFQKLNFDFGCHEFVFARQTSTTTLKKRDIWVLDKGFTLPSIIRVTCNLCG